MDKLLKKLNFSEEEEILIINPPDSFKSVVDYLRGLTKVHSSTAEIEQIKYVIMFVLDQEQIAENIQLISSKFNNDPIIWFCYPKKASKKYKCHIDRDKGWDILGTYNLEPVRQIAIDEDWSALRFRKVENISKITRRESFALTRDAKNRTTKKNQ